MMTPQDPDAPPSLIRIGFICVNPLSDARYQSGMPHQMANALTRAGAEIIEFAEWAPTTPRGTLAARARNRLERKLKRVTPDSLSRSAETAFPQRTVARHKRIARARARKIQHLIDNHTSEQPDVYFVCCAQRLLYQLRTDKPVCFYSDATFPILRETYAWHPTHSPAYYDAMELIEQDALAEVQACVYSSPISQNSAITQLGIASHRTHVVPMGANVMPAQPELVQNPAPAPTRDSCRLLIIAADPVRKRVALALEATEILRKRGINATLNVIGPGTDACQNHPAVEFVRRLQLSESNDRAIHQGLLRDCHIQLLPSLGEAFGIAPIESAHFARPSIVSDAGGLPFVVQHEKTGLVVDAQASASAWADAIETMIDRPEHYQDMSRAALERARDELNWDQWAQSMLGIFRQVVSEHDS